MKQRVIGMSSVLAISLVAASPASGKPWQAPTGGHTAQEYRRNALHWELAYLALSAVDTAETAECISRGRCSEGNPLYGRHPSVGRLIATRAVLDLAHFGIFKFLDDRNPINSRSWAIGSTIVQGGVVALNARFMF